ncbi:MAG: DUF2513 domain-containing protein [Planctomycetota bacterium]
MDLVRQILLCIEAYDHGRAPHNLCIDGFSTEQVGYHVYIMIEGGLLDGANSTTLKSKGYEAIASRITWEGHEFLDAARDDRRWKKACALVKEKSGAVTLAVMSQLLTAMALQSLGLSK